MSTESLAPAPASDHAACFVRTATAPSLPIVFDSPHSGIELPDDFGTVAPRDAILTSWDAFVDELWGSVPEHGGTLIGAHFPRCYIDPNRAIDDIDAALLAEPWPAALDPRPYTLRGMGLIRRDALPGVPMYDRKLSVREVQHRIDHYYRPYRAALHDAAETAYTQHSALWHIDCHSMKSRGNGMNVDNGKLRPDFVISDRRGTTADPAFTHWVAEQLGAAGYRVQVNEPYQGGDLLCAVSDPARRRHSIQIEMNRALYMDEARFTKHDGFETLKRNLDAFVAALASWVRGELARTNTTS